MGSRETGIPAGKFMSREQAVDVLNDADAYFDWVAAGEDINNPLPKDNQFRWATRRHFGKVAPTVFVQRTRDQAEDWIKGLDDGSIVQSYALADGRTLTVSIES